MATMETTKPPSSAQHVNPDSSSDEKTGEGLCHTCGIPIHQRKGFLRKRVNFSNENVHEGICIRCHGELVPASVFLQWHHKKNNPRDSLLLSSPTAAAAGGGLASIRLSFHSVSEDVKVYEKQKHPSSPILQSNDLNPLNQLSYDHLPPVEKMDRRALAEMYWEILKLFRSSRTDPSRPTLEELQNLEEVDWKHVVLISEKSTHRRLLHIGLVYKIPYPAIRFLLQHNASVRDLDVHGSLPLHYACRYGASSIDVLELLLRKDPTCETIHCADQEGCLPLHVACQHNNASASMIQFLLQKDSEKTSVSIRDEDGYLPIHYALERKTNLKVMELLVTADTSTLHAPNPSNLTTISEIAMRYDYSTIQSEGKYTALLNAVVEEMNIHTACRFGVPLETIKLLLDMDSNQTVYKLDDDGNLPLHCALDGSAPPQVIRHLIKVDTKSSNKNNSNSSNKTTMYQKNKDGSTPLLKIALRDDSSSLLQAFPILLQAAQELNIEQEMNLSIKKQSEVSLELRSKHTQLLHAIWQRRQVEGRPSVAELTNFGFSHEVWRRVVLIENDDTGWLPLQWALAFEAPPTTIDFLLEKNHDQSIQHPNLSGSLPIHFACLRGYNFDLIQSLLEKDCTRSTIVQKNSSGKRPLELLPKDSEVIANLVKDARNLDAPETLDFFFQSSPPALFRPAMLKMIEQSNKRTTSFAWLNHAYCQDSVIVPLMLELYLQVVWIALFVHSAVLHVTDEEVPLAFAILLLAMALLLLGIFIRRLFKAVPMEFFFCEPYNLLGIAAIGLVIASSVVLSSDGPVFSNDRPVFMATGALQVASLIFFLKRIFHPIATFVGGVVLICCALIPFAIISGMIILAFTFMLFVKRYGTDVEEELDTFRDSFGYVFAVFLSTPDSTSDWLDLVFAAVSVIVLLNVAIAIVNQNWVAANAKASKLFWIDRLNTILELGRGASRKWAPADTCCNSCMGRHKEASGSARPLMQSAKEGLAYCATFMLGLVTFGWFWPLEMRRHFFPVATEPSNMNRNDELVECLERKIQVLEESIKWNQRMLENKVHDEFDELKSLIVSVQNLQHKAPASKSNDGARVNWTGKPQPFPPSEILVAA